MSEWKEYKLKDIAEIQTGPFGSQLHKSDYVPVGVPCIMPTNIGSHLDLSIDGIARIMEADAIRLSKHIVHTGDIVYARRGDIEKCAYIKDSQNGWFCGTGCLKVYNFKDNVLPLYIAYQLSTDRCKKLISKNAVGTTMPNLNTTILGDISLFVPQLETQQNIASILSSLDSKIECNRKICANLEAQAQALFKHWFIDFAPFKDGKFVETELGMIPEGWRLGTLGSIIIENDKSKVQVNQALQTGKYPFFTSGAKILRFDDYFVSGHNIFLNTGGVADVKFKIGKAAYSTDTWCIHGLYGYSDFLYLYLSRNVKMLNKQYFEGSALKHLQKKKLKDKQILIPSKAAMESFNAFVGNKLEMIELLKEENEKLANSRDTLLPKLMSGQIKP